MNQFRRSNGWSMDCATFLEEFIPGAFVQRFFRWSVAGLPRPGSAVSFVLEATVAHNVRSYSLYLASEQL